MGYGGFNTGGGASSYDLDRLAASIISGHVSAPLTTADGIVIATRDGEEIGHARAFLARRDGARVVQSVGHAAQGLGSDACREADRARHHRRRGRGKGLAVIE